MTASTGSHHSPALPASSLSTAGPRAAPPLCPNPQPRHGRAPGAAVSWACLWHSPRDSYFLRLHLVISRWTLQQLSPHCGSLCLTLWLVSYQYGYLWEPPDFFGPDKENYLDTENLQKRDPKKLPVSEHSQLRQASRDENQPIVVCQNHPIQNYQLCTNTLMQCEYSFSLGVQIILTRRTHLTQKTYLDDLSDFTFWFQLFQFQVCCPHLLVTSEKGPVSQKPSLVEWVRAFFNTKEKLG